MNGGTRRNAKTREVPLHDQSGRVGGGGSGSGYNREVVNRLAAAVSAGTAGTPVAPAAAAVSWARMVIVYLTVFFGGGGEFPRGSGRNRIG